MQVTVKNNSTLPIFMGNPNSFPFTSSSTSLSPTVAFSDPSYSIASGSDNCTGKIVAPQSTCTLGVQFSPAAAEVPSGGSAVISATAYFTGVTDAAVTATVSVSGTGTTRIALPGSGIIATVAGGGTVYPGDNGSALAAALYSPRGLAADAAGNIYIADCQQNRIRKVTASTGVITTVAGNGFTTTQNYGGGGFSGDGGLATNAELNCPEGVAVDTHGNLYIADSANERIRKVTASTGVILTVAGNGYITASYQGGYSGDGGAAVNAELNQPFNVAVDANGNIYIADTSNSRIRKVSASTGIITTVAGNSGIEYNGDGIPATSASLYYPEDIALDSVGNLYIADTYNERIRKVTASSGIINTVAGAGTIGYGGGFSGDGGPATSAFLNLPIGVSVDKTGNIAIADAANLRVREVSATTGIINTVAGNGQQGNSGDGGSAVNAQLYSPNAVAADSNGNIYIAVDSSNDPTGNRVRVVGH